MATILPSRWRSTSAPTDSSYGTSRSTVWSWNSGIASSPSSSRLRSHSRFSTSGRQSAYQPPPSERARPLFVAITRSSGYGRSVSPISRSLTSGP